MIRQQRVYIYNTQRLVKTWQDTKSIGLAIQHTRAIETDAMYDTKRIFYLATESRWLDLPKKLEKHTRRQRNASRWIPIVPNFAELWPRQVQNRNHITELTRDAAQTTRYQVYLKV